MIYKVRGRSGQVIITTRSLNKVTTFLNTDVKSVEKAIKQKNKIQYKYTVESIDTTKKDKTIDDDIDKMIDKGYGASYGKYQVDKYRGII